MNLPNFLSVSRVPVVFLIVCLMVRDTEITNFWAFGLFIASALTDWLDGYLARKLNQITDLGKFLDALADKVLTSGLFIALVALDRMGEDWALFAVLLIVTREFMVTGLRLVAAGKGRVLAAEKLGKWKTAMQMVSIGLFLLVSTIPSSQPDMVLLCFELGWVVFVAATVLTVVSGVSCFVRNRDVFRN